MNRNLDNNNTVVIANAIELITESIVKLMGGEKSLHNARYTRQQIADMVAGKINSALTIEIGAK